MPNIPSSMWRDLREQRFSPSSRLAAMSGLRNAGIGGQQDWLNQSIGAVGLRSGTAIALEDEQNSPDGEYTYSGGGIPGMVGDSTGVSDLHPALIEMTRQAMLDDSPVTSEDKGLALAKAGFAMAAGDSPHALQNIGRGAMIGADALQEMRQQRALQRMREVQAQAMLARALQPRTVAMSPLGRAQQERAQLVAQFGEADPRVKQYDDWIAKQVTPEAAGREGGIDAWRIEQLMAANPGMSRQEATNAILVDREKNKDPQQTDNLLLPDGTTVLGTFDPSKKDYFIKDKNGNWVAAPPGARRVPTTLGTGLSTKPFNDLEKDFFFETEGLNKYNSYLKTVKDSEQGFGLMADILSAKIKTFLDSGELTESEMATAEGRAKLQALLGSSRVNIVGPGPMTEYDAQRVLEALGGDVNALRNKEVVTKIIKNLYQEKRRYAELLKSQLELSAPPNRRGLNKYQIPELVDVEAPPSAGSGPDGGAAGAGSGGARQEWIRDPATGKLRPK